MSSVRGQSFRGGRGSTPQAPTRGRGRGASTSRGRGFGNNVQRGSTIARGGFGQQSRQNGNRDTRGASDAVSKPMAAQRRSSPSASGGTRTRGSWSERFQALTKARERERADAIQQGLIADPEKPRSLADAITPVGTCQEMCAEYERVQRVVQKDVWKEETDPNHSAFAMTDEEPDEARMVKKFRRAAAGLEEQLPSDLRPPPVLKRTCDYLFNEVIGNASSLAHVHHFVWDRTRAIRNDFSIQQLTRSEELRVAIECYERIARFHIVSLHQLALPEKPYSKYDWQQEREQLDRTLLSLMQYYDDSQGRIDIPNEAEFRAYCVIFQLQDPIPDLEDRVQSWPRPIMQDTRVHKALDVYMAACNVLDVQGPLKPRASHLIARQDWQRFWTLVASKEISYLMACVAEIYFNLVRRTALNALFRTSRANSRLETTEWTTDMLCELLAFDDEEEVFTYCERFGFTFKEREDGEQYLDLNSVKGRTLPEPKAGIPKQSKTSLVEDKRFGRTIPAIIDGVAVRQAQNAGMVTEENGGMEDVMEGRKQNDGSINGMGDNMADDSDDGESLFLPEAPKTSHAQAAPSLTNGFNGNSNSSASIFSGIGAGSSFEKPSVSGDTPSIFAPAAKLPEQPPTLGVEGSKFDFTKTTSAGQTSASTSAPAFDFTGKSGLGAGGNAKKDGSSSGSGFSFGQPSKEQSSVSAFSGFPFGQPSKGQSGMTSFGQPTKDQTSVFSNAGAPTAQSSTPSLFQDLNSEKPAATDKQQTTTQTSGGLQQPMSFGTVGGTSPNSPPQQHVNAFTSRPPADPPAASTPSPQGQSSDTKAAQPHFTAAPSATPTINNSNQHSPSSNLNPGIRRPSSSTSARQYKPSPLSHSFTAGDDESNSAAQSEDTTERKNTQAASELFATPQSTAPKTGAVETKDPAKAPPKETESLDSSIARVAQEFFEAPVGGVLDQYIAWHVVHIVTEVKDKLKTEELNAEADEHRHFKLSQKFGRRWRNVFWQRRLAKSGRERRQRRQKRLHERGSQDIEQGGLFDGESIAASSRAVSVAESRDDQSRAGGNMGSFWSNHAPSEQGTSSEPQARPGSRQPASSRGAGSIAPPRESAHKRLKSTSHVDDRGRVTKPSVTNHPNADLLQRSSFLGFSAAKDAPGNNRNTTTTNYFRLKAMGIHRIDKSISPRGNSGNSIAPRGTKRRLSAESQATAQTSPPALRSSSPLGLSPDQSTSRALMPPPSMPPPTPKSNDEDEALFARLRAARQNLEESTSFFNSQTVKDDEFRRSMNTSQSSNEFESPSMAKARSDARLRGASHSAFGGDASVTDRRVPAYRLRESKFVPREQYGKAVERSNEFRVSRSREPSRPGSRNGQHATDHGAKQPEPSASSIKAPLEDAGQVATSLSKPNGVLHKTETSSQPSKAQTSSSNTFPAFASPTPISFANHNTRMSSENPFAQADTSKSFSAFGSQATFGSQPVFGSKDQAPEATKPQDQTVHPSQINQALANSFGNSHGHGHNHFMSLPNNGPIAPASQQNSQAQSEPISLLSDDEDEAEEPDASVTQPRFPENGGAGEASEDLLDESSDEDELRHPYSHVNQYALLAQQADEYEEEDEEGSQSQVDGDDGYEGHDGLNGYAREYEESVDGDIDEDETDDLEEEEGEGYYEDGDETLRYEDDEDGEDQWDGEESERSLSPPPQKNEALQGVGDTAEEAIELSD